MEDSPQRLGDILIEAGVITPAQLERALELQKNRQLRLGTILLQEEIVSEPQLVQALGRRLSIPWVNLYHLDIDNTLLELVPVSVAEEFFLIPIYIRTTGSGERSLYVAMNDPMDNSALRFVAASAGMTVKPMIAAPSDISAAIRLYYYGEEEDLTDEPPPPIPPTTGATISALPPPVTKAHAKPVPPPPTPDQARDSKTPPPPPTEEVVKDIEELLQDDSEGDVIEPDDIEELSEDDVAEGDASEEEDEDTGDESEEETEDETEEETVEESATDEDDAGDQEPESEESEEEKQLSQREIEKHLFGVGGGAKPKGISLTLLDGTTIAFGGASKKSKQKETLTREDLIAGLRASAKEDTPLEGYLPSTKWEDYIAAILEVLFKKHLVLFDEFMEAINKKKPSE